MAGTSEDSDTLVVTIKLKSGRFESSIHVPLFATKEQRDEFIDAWFNLMETALRMGNAKDE